MLLLRDNRDTRSRSTADSGGAVYGGECRLPTIRSVAGDLESYANLNGVGSSGNGYWDPVRQDSSQ
jgi:hypothetical protein